MQIYIVYIYTYIHICSANITSFHSNLISIYIYIFTNLVWVKRSDMYAAQGFMLLHSSGIIHIHIFRILFIVWLKKCWMKKVFFFLHSVCTSSDYKQYSENMYMNYAWWMQQHETLSSIHIKSVHSNLINII